MSDKFGRHSEKRISELHQRMRDSKLRFKRKYKYWNYIFKMVSNNARWLFKTFREKN